MSAARMRMVLRQLAVAAAVFAVAVPLPAAAQAPAARGWWWRAQTSATVTVPAPQQVPEGGLYVEGAPDGANAISAVRFVLAPGVRAEKLALTVAQEQGGENALLLACPAITAWVAADAGQWQERPQADCEGKGVVGQRAEDGSTWSFALGLMETSSTIDLVLMPGRDESRPDALNGAVFSIAFAPPGNDALVVSTPSRRQPEPPYEPPPYSPPAQEFFAPPLEGGSDEPQDVPSESVQDPSVLTPKITKRPQATRDTPAVAAPDAGKNTRALATLIALLSVGAAGMLSRGRGGGLAPERRASSRMGGIGRFRRPRSGPPPAL